MPILRAGLVLLEQAASVLPASETYHVGLVRDESTLQVSLGSRTADLPLCLSLALKWEDTKWRISQCLCRCHRIVAHPAWVSADSGIQSKAFFHCGSMTVPSAELT